MFVHSIQHGPSQAIYAAIKLIKEADKEILLSTYVLEGQGHAGKCLIDAIVKSKASSIKFLSNHYSLFSQKTLDYLALFPCISNKLQVRVWKHRYMNSNHAKFVIQDNTTVHLGGYNFQETLFMEPEYAWNDLGITVSNPQLAHTLSKYFYQLWNQSEIVECNSDLSNNLDCPIMPVGRVLKINQQIDDYTILNQIPKYLFLHSHQSKAFQSIIKAFQSATNSIDILSPNVIDSCIWEILIYKLKTIKGFQIRIITNENHNSSASFMSLLAAENSFFCSKQRNFREGLHIRYSNKSMKKTIKLKTDNKHWPVCIDHSKYFCIDLKQFYIGSFNMDSISLHACGESGIIIYDPILSQKVNAFLFDVLFNKAVSIDC